MEKRILILSFLLLFQLSYSKFEENFEQIQIKIFCGSLSPYINEALYFGKEESRFSFTTYFFDYSRMFDPNKIEAETQYQTVLMSLDGSNNYTISCRLWNSYNIEISGLCTFKGQIKTGNFNLKDASFIYRNKYNVTISYNCNPFKIIQYDSVLPYLYAPKQSVEYFDLRDFFEIKFNIEIYNNEKLILFPYMQDWQKAFELENCEKNNKQLICRLSKQHLLKNAISSSDNFYLVTAIKEIDSIYRFVDVQTITVIWNSEKEKENIYVKITKLLKNITEAHGTMIYETNVTDILDIHTNLFSLKSSNIDLMQCIFRKYGKEPLLLVCRVLVASGDRTLGEIDKMYTLKYINVNYNFHILPVNNSEKFHIMIREGGFPYFSNPKVFDYTLESSILLLLAGEKMNNLEGISLNIEKGNLECLFSTNYYVKKCIVPKSHFDGKTSGDYYLYYTNKLGEKTKLYELPPVKVILTGEGNYSSLLKKPSMLVFALFMVLIS